MFDKNRQCKYVPVDDPTERVDKTDRRNVENTTCFQHYRPQPYPHFVHRVINLIQQ